MSNYERVNLEVKKAIEGSVSSEGTQKKLRYIQSFLDASIKDMMTKQFDSAESKIEFMTSILFQIRDYLTSEFTENSLKLSLLNVFNQIEEKVAAEIDHQKKTEEESLILMQEEPQEQDQ